MTARASTLADVLPDTPVDLLVAGAGAAGMAAAVVARLKGLSVTVCEKSDRVGGTTATSAGTLWIPGNYHGRAAAYDDRPEQAAAYMTALSGNDGGAKRRIYLSKGPDVIAFLEQNTELKFVSAGKHPDYRSNVAGAAVYGRAIAPMPFDGRLLGQNFERVKPPIGEFMVFGGMMLGKADIMQLVRRYSSVSAFLYAARLALRYFKDRLRFSRGTRLVMGNALVAGLYYSALKLGVHFRFRAALSRLISEDGVVSGAVFSTPEGETAIKARRGVVLATGGVAHNAALRAKVMPRVVPFSLSAESNTGDGITAALDVGAVFDPVNHRGGGLWTPVSKTPARKGWRGLFPHLYLDRAKPGVIAVDKTGRRFTNEAASYHDFVEAMLRVNADDPARPVYLICTNVFVRCYGLGAIYPGTRGFARFERAGCIETSASIGGLADKIGVDPAVLESTLVRFNGQVLTGRDEDFGRGETELDRFNGDPDHMPNPCLGPVGGGDRYIAMPVWAADIAVSAGLNADEDGRVLDDKGSPIIGLYTCGNDMGSVMQGTYPGPGTTLGPALVFAYQAACRAAGDTIAITE